MYSAASKEEILGAKVTVASLFFGKVFGDVGQRALTVFIALSALGNVMTVVRIPLKTVNQPKAFFFTIKSTRYLILRNVSF